MDQDMKTKASEVYPSDWAFQNESVARVAFRERYGMDPDNSLQLSFYAKNGRAIGNMNGRVDRERERGEAMPTAGGRSVQEELPLGAVMENPVPAAEPVKSKPIPARMAPVQAVTVPVEEPLPALPDDFGASSRVCDNSAGTAGKAVGSSGSTTETGGAKMTNGLGASPPTAGGALITTGNRAIAPGTTLADIQRLVRQKYPKADDAEIALLFYQADKAGLDPLSGQIHLVPRYNSQIGKNVSTLQYGIDGLRAIADRTGNYAGNDSYLYDEGISEFQARADGRKHPTIAKATVYKIVQGLRVAFSAEAAWDSYCPAGGGLWGKFGYLMLGKCAEALALRKAFPADLSGKYEAAEMEQATAGVKDVPAPEAPKSLAEPTKEPEWTHPPVQPMISGEVPVKDVATDQIDANPTPSDMRTLASAVKKAGTTIVAERAKRGWVGRITRNQAVQIAEELSKAVAG